VKVKELETVGKLEENKKKFIAYSSYLSSLLGEVSLIFKFVFFILFMIGYFVLVFVLCLGFISSTANSYEELRILIDQSFNAKLVYWSFQEYIGTKRIANIQGVNSEEYTMLKIENMLINL
jgi:hypothetical protein